MSLNCRNFKFCQEKIDEGCPLCTTCYWAFEKKPLTFGRGICGSCEVKGDTVKWKQCSHFTCIACFRKHYQNNICPICFGA